MALCYTSNSFTAFLMKVFENGHYISLCKEQRFSKNKHSMHMIHLREWLSFYRWEELNVVLLSPFESTYVVIVRSVYICWNENCPLLHLILFGLFGLLAS